MKCSSGLHVASFPFSRTLFSSKGSLVYNDRTCILQRKLTRTERVPFLLFAALISLHLFRAVRAATSPSPHPFFDHFPNVFSNERFPRLTDSLPLYLSSLHQLPLCSRAPAISYRNLSCAPKHFSENRLARAVAGQSPKCWRSRRAHPAKIAPLSRPTYPARYVCTYICYICDWKNFPPICRN